MCAKRQADRYKNIGELIKDLKKVRTNINQLVLDNTSNFESHTKIIPAIDIGDVDTMKSKKDNRNIKKPKRKMAL